MSAGRRGQVFEGFVLQPTYRIVDERPVVHLFGKLEDGRTFLVRDDRQVPHFFVEATEADKVESGRVLDSDFQTMHGSPLKRVEMPVPGDVPSVRDKLHALGVRTYEADVRFAMRYLIDRGVRGSVRVRGEPLAADGVDVAFDNPQVEPGSWSLEPSVLSIDIETDIRTNTIISVALDGCGVSEVILSDVRGPIPHNAVGVRDERALLSAFVQHVRVRDPDVITGWNVIDFDMHVLIDRAQRHNVPMTLGRGPGNARVRRLPGRGGSTASIPGRLVLDGLQLLRGAFIKMERFGLDFVAREVVGIGKTLTGPSRAEDIYRLHEQSPAQLVEYNLNDARLVNQILDKLSLIELAVARSKLTGMPLDRVSSAIASVEFLYLMELGKRKIAAPTVRPAEERVELSGGHVLDPTPGLYEHVLVFDFASLYPSIIRTFQIDPLGVGTDADDAIVAPNGARFSREPAILPRLLDELVPQRAQAKKRGDAVASQAMKILMNSFYGVLGTSACRLFDPALANAITGFGREILLWTRDRIEERGYRVIYGDTDSLFVLSDAGDLESANRLGKELAAELNEAVDRWVADTWNVVSKLELEFEKCYVKLVLPAVRHGEAGARKRYAGLIRGSSGNEVVFTGMESVRRDWTKLAKRVQHELYRRLFDDEPVDEYLSGVVASLRAGELDGELVYRKALRKPLAEYVANTPPHVAAARKMSTKPDRLVAYVITTEGPEPAKERVNPLDYEHYVAKQVRPVTEPVLAVLGLSFRQIVGDGRQQRLF